MIAIGDGQLFIVDMFWSLLASTGRTTGEVHFRIQSFSSGITLCTGTYHDLYQRRLGRPTYRITALSKAMISSVVLILANIASGLNWLLISIVGVTS